MMADPYIIDAGPAINFLATKNERILIAAIGRFQAPEGVRDEVMNKASENPRLAAAAEVWRKIERNWIEVLPAQRSRELDRIANILTRGPLPKVPSRAKDLGETYVVVHATQRALEGDRVFVIIDDRGGQELAARAQRYLSVQRGRAMNVGTLDLVTSETILRSQIRTGRIPDKPTMRRVYEQLQKVNSGFGGISTTDLLTHKRWSLPPLV